MTLLMANLVTDLPFLVVQGVIFMTAGTKPTLTAARASSAPPWGRSQIVLWLPLTCFPLYVLPS